MTVLSKVFTYESLVHAIAGTLGGGVAMGALYPLDQVRLILQVEDREETERVKKYKMFGALMDILEERGYAFLYQGHVSTQLALGVSNFIYFYCYSGLKAAMEDFLKKGQTKTLALSTKVEISPLQSLVLASIADCYRSIVREEGFQALWNGTIPSLVLVSNPVINYFTYDFIKTRWAAVRGSEAAKLGPLDFFLMGVFAKSVATVLTYPLQIAQSRMRVKADSSKEGSKSTSQYSGLLDCLHKIYRQHGLKGWFAGMEAKLLLTVSMAAFQMMTYEEVVKLVFALMYHKNPKPAVK